MATVRWLLFPFVSIALGCSAADTAAESFGGAAGEVGSGGAGQSGNGGGGFAGFAAAAGFGGSGATGGSGGVGGGSAGAGGSGGGYACVPMPACDAPLPDFGSERPWKKGFESSIIAGSGFANHRGRDLVLTPSSPQWVIGKFAYGVIDKDLKGEEVDVWLNRDCGTSWEKLGTAITTEENAHPTVEGVNDSGGRIFFQIPDAQKLAIGRHRLELVVAGDLSHTEVLIEVLPSNAPFFVSDVDGTLTTEETEEYGALLTGNVSQARPDAATALGILVEKGYRPFYLTARPEFLVGRTREFIQLRGMPRGLVHTTLALGATGAAAVTFKNAELSDAIGRGVAFGWAFGNTDTDAQAYFSSGIQPNERRVFVQFTDAAHGGRRIESYSELLAELSALPNVCP